MSYLAVQPDLIATAAADLEQLRTAIGAATPATGVLAAAADEVSVAFAQLMNDFAAEYQGAARQATAFQEQFARILTGGGLAYVQTELANAVGNALNPVLSPIRSLLGNVAAAPAAGVFTLVMGASGYPIPIED